MRPGLSRIAADLRDFIGVSRPARTRRKLQNGNTAGLAASGVFLAEF
jgi:hypothetical protein